MKTDTYDTIVIGGGQAGLSVGYHLAKRSTRFVILDGFDISGGGIVREARYSRAIKKTFEPAVLWLTGLSGAGSAAQSR